MKPLHTILFSALVTLLLFSVVGYTSCKKSNSCENVVCQNGGTCTDGKCACPAGYEGALCEKPTGYYCEHTPCQNGGTCVGYCRCIGNYTGKYCEIDLCKDVVCLNGGTCKEGKCQCAPGYEGARCGVPVRNKYIGRWRSITKNGYTLDTAILTVDTVGVTVFGNLRVGYALTAGAFSTIVGSGIGSDFGMDYYKPIMLDNQYFVFGMQMYGDTLRFSYELSYRDEGRPHQASLNFLKL